MSKAGILTPKEVNAPDTSDFDRHLRSEEAKDWHGNEAREKQLSAKRRFSKSTQIYAHGEDIGFAAETTREHTCTDEHTHEQHAQMER